MDQSYHSISSDSTRPETPRGTPGSSVFGSPLHSTGRSRDLPTWWCITDRIHCIVTNNSSLDLSDEDFLKEFESDIGESSCMERSFADIAQRTRTAACSRRPDQTCSAHSKILAWNETLVWPVWEVKARTGTTGLFQKRSRKTRGIRSRRRPRHPSTDSASLRVGCQSLGYVKGRGRPKVRAPILVRSRRTMATTWSYRTLPPGCSIQISKSC